MIIEHRNHQLKGVKNKKNEKVRIVLDWLLEFRFSTLDLLSQRIESNKVNSHRFFAQLFKDDVIRKFKNVHTKYENYIIMSSIGKSYLEGMNRNVSKAVTTSFRLGNYTTLLHDLAVQKSIINRINQFEKVIWDKNIRQTKLRERPDALLLSKKGYWIALEYERWRKSNPRTYFSMRNHVQSILEKQYSAVLYLFDKENDKIHYQKLFNEKKWIEYQRMSHTGKIEKTGKIFIPDKIQNIRKCFLFVYEPI